MNATQALKNAVLDGSMKGEGKTFRFDQKEGNDFLKSI